MILASHKYCEGLITKSNIDIPPAIIIAKKRIWKCQMMENKRHRFKFPYNFGLPYPNTLLKVKSLISSKKRFSYF